MALTTTIGRLRGLRSGVGLSGGKSTLIVFASLPLIAVMVFLLIMTRESFLRENVDGWTLENFRVIYSDPFVYGTLLNTLGFTIVTVAVAAFFGVITAWVVERTDLPFRGAVFPIITLGVVTPGFVTAMGWLLLLHQRIGLLNKWLVAIVPGLEQSPLHVGTVVGMGFVQGISLSGLMFIMVAASFRAMDPSLEESADVHGVKLFHRLRKVTFPLAWPGILAASIYITTIGFAAFEVPAIIGMGNNIYTFSTFLFNEINPDDAGLPRYGVAAASSALMLILAVVLSIWYLRIVRRSNRYAVVTGKGYRPKLYHLRPKAVLIAWAFVITNLLLAMVMPFLVLVWASLTPYFQTPTLAAFATVTLDSYRFLSWDIVGGAAKNTLIIVIAVPTLTAIFGLMISWVVTRSRTKGVSSGFEIMAFIPHAVPNIIFAVGALILGLRFLPEFIPFYGTVYILIVVFVITRISFATRVYNASFIQIHHELDEAGYVFGLSRVTVLWRILRPLLTPALLYTWVWMAMLAYRELTLAAVLASRENTVLAMQAWTLWQSDLTKGAALTVVMTLGMLPLVAVYFFIARRVGRMSA